MGLIDRAFTVAFGDGRNLLRDTVEVFRENAETSAERAALLRHEALQQFGAEFMLPRRRRFDMFMDGVNRLPRPMLALGTLGLLGSAMIEPVWFAERMQGIALVPEPLWWLLGAIVSFYFGARHQVKSQEFQHQLNDGLLRASQVTQNLRALRSLKGGALVPAQADTRNDAQLARDASTPEANAALEQWQTSAQTGR